MIASYEMNSSELNSSFSASREKWLPAFLHILVTYAKQYNRTMKRHNKPIERSYLFRVKSWVYPSKMMKKLDILKKNSKNEESHFFYFCVRPP